MQSQAPALKKMSLSSIMNPPPLSVASQPENTPPYDNYIPELVSGRHRSRNMSRARIITCPPAPRGIPPDSPTYLPPRSQFTFTFASPGHHPDAGSLSDSDAKSDSYSESETGSAYDDADTDSDSVVSRMERGVSNKFAYESTHRPTLPRHLNSSTSSKSKSYFADPNLILKASTSSNSKPFIPKLYTPKQATNNVLLLDGSLQVGIVSSLRSSCARATRDPVKQKDGDKDEEGARRMRAIFARDAEEQSHEQEQKTRDTSLDREDLVRREDQNEDVEGAIRLRELFLRDVEGQKNAEEHKTPEWVIHAPKPMKNWILRRMDLAALLASVEGVDDGRW